MRMYRQAHGRSASHRRLTQQALLCQNTHHNRPAIPDLAAWAPLFGLDFQDLCRLTMLPLVMPIYHARQDTQELLRLVALSTMIQALLQYQNIQRQRR